MPPAQQRPPASLEDDDDDYDEEEELVDQRGQQQQQQQRRGPGANDEAVVMAVSRKGNKLGFACFDEEKSCIFVAELLATTDLRETVQALKLHLGPTSFLLDPHQLADEDFCKLLSCAVAEERPEFHVKVSKTRNWDYKRSISNLCGCLKVRELEEASRVEEEALEDDLLLASMTGGSGGGGGGGGAGGGGGRRNSLTGSLNPRRNYDRLSAVVDFTGETLLVRALGALLVHLQATTFQLEVGGLVPIRALRRFDLGAFVHLDANTLSSLHIFFEEKHPNVISGKGRSKEGFSLFALLDQTRSRPGRACLKEWMLKPLRSVDRIVQRQLLVELLMQPESMEVVANCRRLLGKVADVQRCLVRLRRAVSTYHDWLKLSNSAQHVLLLHNCLSVLLQLAVRRSDSGGSADAAAIVQALMGRISRESVGKVGEEIGMVVDVELTRETKTVTLRTGYDDELDRLRAQYDTLEEFLAEEARNLLAEQSSRLLSTVSVQFLPQVGFLVIVKANEKVAVENDPRFRFVFAQGDCLYYKTPRMDVLDDQIGDVSASMRDREAIILRLLGESVLEEELPLTEAVRACAELDVLISFAQIGGGLNWVRPNLTEERVVIVKDGRHPLQELAVDTFIPNDVYLVAAGAGEEDRGLAVVTGPNYSGKSVYLKMVGVLVYLAHLGSFLPCQQALIGLVDAIYTRIASAETVTVQQSTFTIDCSQMNAIFRGATQDSLVLVDEFGKGSAEIDGLSLLVACMANLQRLHARVLVTTHFLEILQRQGLVSPHVVQELCYRMDVFVPPPSTTSAADGGPPSAAFQAVVPLFKLTRGVASSSDGFSCAVLAGLAAPIVRRAEFIAQCHVEGTLPVKPLAQPLIQVGGLKSSQLQQMDEEGGGEGGQQQQQQQQQQEGLAGSNVLRFNPAAREVLDAFLRLPDWTFSTDDELQAFCGLLQTV